MFFSKVNSKQTKPHHLVLVYRSVRLCAPTHLTLSIGLDTFAFVLIFAMYLHVHPLPHECRRHPEWGEEASAVAGLIYYPMSSIIKANGTLRTSPSAGRSNCPYLKGLNYDHFSPWAPRVFSGEKLSLSKGDSALVNHFPKAPHCFQCTVGRKSGC